MKVLAWMVGAGACLIAIILCFRRAYVIPSNGLGGVSSQCTGESVRIRGSLVARGAKLVRTTLSRDGRAVLLRIYADAIRDEDDPRRRLGSFSVQVPLTSEVNAVEIGDSPRFLTIGVLCGIPVRLPRLHEEPGMKRVLWRR
jgi:hypothetical protein